MIIFNVTHKKNNQSLVSDADREIPTLGSTDNAGNNGKTRYPRLHFPFIVGLGFLGLHRRPMIDSILSLVRDVERDVDRTLRGHCWAS